MLISCSNDSIEDGKKDDSSNVEQSETETKVYQIGESAVITSDIYEFDYEVTVTDFELTREFEGVKLEDFLLNAQDAQRFVVVNVIVKNISDHSYIPNDMFSANFSAIDEESGQTSYDEFFTIGDKELEPGEG